MMSATKFEFERRFWIFGVIFGLGFALYAVDHVGFLRFALHLLAPSLDPDSARGIEAQQAIIAVGATLIFYAALFRTWATSYLGADIVQDGKLHSDALVVDGPYRYVRNPLYFANLPLAAGIGCIASRAGWLFMVAAMFLFVYRLALREEVGLRAQLGKIYAQYADKVPMLWPSLRPRYPASGRKPRWGQAIAGELLFWLFGATVLCFAITLDQMLMALGFIASFALAFAVRLVMQKWAGTEK